MTRTTGYPGDWTKRRKDVLDRDDHECRNCGDDEVLHVHHIVPLSENGTNTRSNLVTLCRECHYRAHHELDADHDLRVEDRRVDSTGLPETVASGTQDATDGESAGSNSTSRGAGADEEQTARSEGVTDDRGRRRPYRPWRTAPIWTRLWWWLFGRDVEAATARD